MNKTGKIIVIGAGILLTASVLLIIYGQDKRRKKAYNTAVPPEYARQIIQEVTGK